MKNINLIKSNLTKKTFIDFYKSIVSGELSVITDEHDNIVGVHCCKSTGMKYAKMLSGHLTVGNTLEELEADKEAMYQFMADYKGQPIVEWTKLSLAFKDQEISHYKDNKLASLTKKMIWDKNGNVIKDYSNKSDEVATELIKQYLNLD